MHSIRNGLKLIKHPLGAQALPLASSKREPCSQHSMALSCTSPSESAAAS